MSKEKSKFKCTIEKGAIPISRFISKNKLEQLKSTFNSNGKLKPVKCNLRKSSMLASVKQKESKTRAEKAKSESKFKKPK